MGSLIDIPMFSSNNHKTFNPETDPNKMKLTEYKKLYGRKFSRYNKEANTIDITNLNDVKDKE